MQKSEHQQGAQVHQEIREVIDRAIDRGVPPYQIMAAIMAIVTRAISQSGNPPAVRALIMEGIQTIGVETPSTAQVRH